MRFFYTVLPLVLASMCALMVTCFFGSVYKLTTDAFFPTFLPGDVIWVSKHMVFERGHVIVFEHQGAPLVRRILALPGDRVMRDASGLRVNGRLLHGAGKKLGQLMCYQELAYCVCEKDVRPEPSFRVPSGHFYVAPDLRTASNSFLLPMESALGEAKTVLFSLQIASAWIQEEEKFLRHRFFVPLPSLTCAGG